jgi:hypothetical protein
VLGYSHVVTIETALRRVEPVSAVLYGASLGSVGLCLALWIRAKTVDQEERGNAERRALFVGLWPPTLWLLGDTVRELARRSPTQGANRCAKH